MKSPKCVGTDATLELTGVGPSYQSIVAWALLESLLEEPSGSKREIETANLRKRILTIGRYLEGLESGPQMSGCSKQMDAEPTHAVCIF